MPSTITDPFATDEALGARVVVVMPGRAQFQLIQVGQGCGTGLDACTHRAAQVFDEPHGPAVVEAGDVGKPVDMGNRVGLKMQ